MLENSEIKTNENGEMEALKKEYEEKLQIAVGNYKKASAKLEFAFDSYEETCIKEEMDEFRQEVKDLREKINSIDSSN